MSPHAASSEQPLLCDPKDVGTPTVRVDSFSSNIYTGSQFEAVINALHVAACCAGTAVLPDHGADFPDRTVSTCFDFRHTQRTAKAACPAMSGPSISWFNGHGVMQHCGDAHTSKLRPAVIGAMLYANVQPKPSECEGDGIDYETSLVAHVRSWDIFAGGIHALYGQPALSYYLSAFSHSGLARLVVVAADARSPVVRLLHMAKTHLKSPIEERSSSWHNDLHTLMCARHLVLSRSSINSLLLTSTRVRHAYVVEPGINGWRAASDAWLASCRHSRVFSATVRATHAATNWDASPPQLLALLTDGWNRTVKFAPTRTMCVNVTARQTVRAKSARQ